MWIPTHVHSLQRFTHVGIEWKPTWLPTVDAQESIYD